MSKPDITVSLQDQRLRPGDRILQIGRINVQGMSSQQVAGLLRQPETIIEVIIGRPINVTDTPEDSLCKDIIIIIPSIFFSKVFEFHKLLKEQIYSWSILTSVSIRTPPHRGSPVCSRCVSRCSVFTGS